MAEGSAPRRIFILVHGTFAPDAPWTQAESPFRKELSSYLPGSEFVAFRWSGKNSHSARLQAGRDLATFVRQTMASNQGARLYLVSHSHGGNVALYATRETDVGAAITGIITIATPFIPYAPDELPLI